MTHLMRLALASAWNRRATLVLTVGSIALSTSMLLAVERTRTAARAAFEQSVSGTDLIVGPRSGPVQLLLQAVFHLGEATHALSWHSVEVVSSHPAVAWAVPLTVGDSHRGFPVVGTQPGYFEHVHHGYRKPLEMAQGRPFTGRLDGVFEAVLGAEVAQSLGYRIDERIALSHGAEAAELADHADKPFTVVGILARTGTPVDRTVLVGLQGIEAVHLDWQAGAPVPGLSVPAEQVRKFDLGPKTVTALFVGLKSRAAVFRVQRDLHALAGEPLLAVLPGVALGQLWEMVGMVERGLLAVAALVVAVALTGMVAVVVTSLNERRRELAILRSVGAGPRHVAALLLTESLIVTAAGAACGVAGLAAAGLAGGPWVEARFGLALPVGMPSHGEWALLGTVIAAGLLAGAPAWRAGRLSLSDGLSPRL